MNKVTHTLVIILFFSSLLSIAQPRIGAEIWIEPGQKPERIDTWFRVLSESSMPVARLFIMWNYIERKAGVYDFTLYDAAFDAAKKYHVKIEATLTVNHGPAFLDPKFWYSDQDGRIPQTQKQLDMGAKYLAKVVERYKDHSALDNWWLMNEPGQLNSHDELAMASYKKWLKKKYSTIDSLNHAWLTAFLSFDLITYDASWDASGGFTRPAPFLDWSWFWRDHMTWYMSWIASNIRAIDTVHPLHVNPHGIFDILPKYDLPAWGTFLSSLGASIHPSWHFSMFERDQYAYGVSAVCKIIKGAIEPKPFWVSELQGGNNTYSGGNPLCPTRNDISQWVWTGVGSGAQNVIFWCLNWRMDGGESGEWSLLDFFDKPSDRLEEASSIAKTLNANSDFFKNASPVNSKVTILLSPETMLILARKDNFKDIEARKAQAHIKSVMAYFIALQELGISAELKQIDQYDWKNKQGEIAVIAHAVSVRGSLIPIMEQFVYNGNKLIVSDLTGYFDENEHNVLQTGNPMRGLLGGDVKEIKLIADSFGLKMNIPPMNFPVHMWMSEIVPISGEALATSNGAITAMRNKIGAGEVVWVPSMISLGAWLFDNAALSNFASIQCEQVAAQLPFVFDKQYKNVMLNTLKNGNNYVTIITNGSMKPTVVKLKNTVVLKAEVIYGKADKFNAGSLTASLGGRETLVVLWRE